MSKLLFVRRRLLLVLVIVATLLPSCTLLQDDLSPKLGSPRKAPNSVTVLWTQPARKYVVLARSTGVANSNETKAQLESRLKFGAAVIGGDAVIVLSHEKSQSPPGMRNTSLVIQWVD